MSQAPTPLPNPVPTPGPTPTPVTSDFAKTFKIGMFWYGVAALVCINGFWNNKRDLYAPMIANEARMAANCPPPEAVRHMVRSEDRTQCTVYYNALHYFLRGN